MRQAAFLIPLTSLLFTVPAGADERSPPVWRLRYSESQDVRHCPGEARLRQEVQLRMGYDPFTPDAPDELEVSIARRKGDLVAQIEYRDASGQVSGQRDFTLPNTDCSCWSLVTYVAVAIAFRRAPPGPPVQPAACPALPAPIPTSTPPAPHVTTEIREEEEEAQSFQIGLGGLGGIGLAPSVSAGTYWFAGLRWPTLSMAIEGRALAPAATEGEEGTPVEIGLIAGAIVPCYHGQYLFGCGVMQIGALRLNSDATGDADKGSFLVGVGLRAGAELPLRDRLSLRAHAEMMTAFTTAIIRLDTKEVWGTPVVSGYFGAGLVVAL